MLVAGYAKQRKRGENVEKYNILLFCICHYSELGMFVCQMAHLFTY